MHILTKQIQSLANNDDTITFLSNSSALLKEHFGETNWLGFYLIKNSQLHLGPFQGKVACELIDIGKGVCGTSVLDKSMLNIGNVHEFKGHIACDNASNSEIVFPLIYNDIVLGVLDIDSPKYNRFTKNDEELLKEIVEVISFRLGNKKDI